MFIIGPNPTFTPLPLNSCPIAFPRALINVRLNVAAALIPAGNAVTKSVRRTPSGLSSRQSPGNAPDGGMLPTQRPFIQPTPVETFAFWASVSVLTSFFALACAAAQAGAKSGTSGEPGGGGDLGEVEGKTPGTGVPEGVGKDVNGYEEIGRVIRAV